MTNLFTAARPTQELWKALGSLRQLGAEKPGHQTLGVGSVTVSSCARLLGRRQLPTPPSRREICFVPAARRRVLISKKRHINDLAGPRIRAGSRPLWACVRILDTVSGHDTREKDGGNLQASPSADRRSVSRQALIEGRVCCQTAMWHQIAF